MINAENDVLGLEYERICTIHLLYCIQIIMSQIMINVDNDVLGLE